MTEEKEDKIKCTPVKKYCGMCDDMTDQILSECEAETFYLCTKCECKCPVSNGGKK